MKLKLVSFNLAKKLKEIGFTGFYNTTDYIKVYDNGYSFKDVGQLTEVKGEDEVGVNYYCLAPTLELAKMWFREKHNICISVDINICKEYFFMFTNILTGKNIRCSNTYYKTYEAALEKALLEVCNLIKNK